MTNALLTYASNPTQVAISAGQSTSQVGITFSVTNATSSPVAVAQIVLTLPQGPGATDLLAPNSTFATGSVHSSDGVAWSLSPSGNQALLVPVSSQGYATVAVGGSLQFTLSEITVNSAGAGDTAQIGVVESLYNGGNGDASIPVGKIEPGFRIEAFRLDQYNVAVGSPVTVTWQVVGALSCEVEAKIIDVAGRDPHSHHHHHRGGARGGGGACGIGTSNPDCDGTITSGTVLSGSNTCNVQGATAFTLTAQGTGNGGDVTLSSQLLVTVNEPAINFTGFPPAIDLGQTVQLHWVSADAGKLQLYTVPSQGQPSVTDLTSTPVGTSTLQPLLTTSYTLYAFTNAGDTQPARQLTVDVAVEQPQWTTPLSSSGVPTPAYPGDLVTLTWAVADVASCNLTCDQSGFAPQNGLKPADSIQIALPDPGVANATATFTMTPVEFGTLGDFTVSTTQIPITNLPHFSQNLAANPATVAQGANVVFTWGVDHADTATISCDVPGTTPVTVDPASGTQTLASPDIPVPTTATYTITATRSDQKYSSATSVAVQCAGTSTTYSLVSPDAGGLDGSYVNGLYLAHPNQRISQIQLQYVDGSGVAAILIWYGTSGGADYTINSLGSSAGAVRKIPELQLGDSQTTLTMDPGDYLVAASGYFCSFVDDDIETVGLMTWLLLTTANGKTVSIGVMPGGGTLETIVAPPGNQIIALDWCFDYGRMGGIGLVTCPSSYGG